MARGRVDPRRITPHPSYEISHTIRKLVETVFGDAKQPGTLRRIKVRGRDKVAQVFRLTMAAVNLRRGMLIFFYRRLEILNGGLARILLQCA